MNSSRPECSYLLSRFFGQQLPFSIDGEIISLFSLTLTCLRSCFSLNVRNKFDFKVSYFYFFLPLLSAGTLTSIYVCM